MLAHAYSNGRAVRGSTLIELLTVIGIISVLAGVIIGVGGGAAKRGQVARAKAELATLSAALESYRRQYGDYPETGGADILLQSLIGKLGPTGQSVDGRAHLDLARFKTAGALDPFDDSAAQLVDPWEQPYRYAFKSAAPWTNPSFVLYSIGKDGSAAALLNGGFIDDAAAANADNVYANR